MSESKVLEAVDSRSRELIEFAQTLLSKPSENPPGGEKNVAYALKEAIDRYSLGGTLVIGSDPARPNVITTLKGNRPGKRFLYDG